MVEEKVIQQESVASTEQPVAETPVPEAPNLDALKAEYETKISSLQKELSVAQEDRKGVKRKLDDVYQKQDEQRKNTLEDQ